ncbi:hypothetical protein Drose_02350 [Dactylosporangium roseum]|uniref:Uncharacterized protein n=1 Tax=Dactylosporangium roseum TaxID=47989 RepID=A0ABY5Z548_9ACTN|nr:hypothetical protein [Dactylosporangium roseum]UWZ37176.1 hypothetical protein Drose_02350 [Dactylosporangium roseum]
MGKAKKNSNFDSRASRGISRSDDDFGHPDDDRSGDMTISPDMIGSGESTNANTATMRAKTKMQQDQQTSLQDKRGNLPDR